MYIISVKMAQSKATWWLVKIIYAHKIQHWQSHFFRSLVLHLWTQASRRMGWVVKKFLTTSAAATMYLTIGSINDGQLHFKHHSPVVQLIQLLSKIMQLVLQFSYKHGILSKMLLQLLAEKQLKLEGKYSLESRDPRKSEIRAHLHP